MSEEPATTAFPADHGLSTLGVLMQLAGSVCAAMSLLTLTVIPWGFNSKFTVGLLVIGVLSGVRSLVHRAAGKSLTDGRPKSEMYAGPLRALRTYAAVGLGHSLLVGLVFHMLLDAPARHAYGLALGLALWPIAIQIIFMQRRFRTINDGVPQAEDRGLEGLGIVMFVFGTCGVLAAGVITALLLKSADLMLQNGPGVLVVLGIVGLGVRSLMHLQAGHGALKETDFVLTTQRMHRYANVGVLASFAAVGTLFIATLIIDAADKFVFLGLGVLLLVLLVWPHIVREFVSRREIAALESGPEIAFHRAPDAGLTSLGWLLLGLAVFRAAIVVPGMISGIPVQLPMFGSRGMEGILPWWQLSIVVLQLWAAIELLNGGPYRRWIASAYGVIAAGLILWKSQPLLAQLHENVIGLSPDAIASLVPLTLSLVAPLATLFLVNRNTGVAARAVVRT